MTKQLKEIGSQMFRAIVDANTVNIEERTVEVVFATDNPVRMYSWEDGRVDEVLSLEDGHVRWTRINSGAPLLDNHQRWGSIDDTQIGVVERAWKDESGKGRAKVRFSKKPKADSIFQDVQDKIVRNISVGYSVYAYEKTEREGQVPLYRAIDWEPFEISFVPVPADFTAGVRSQQNANESINTVTIYHKNKQSNMTLEQMRAEVARLRAIASPSEAEIQQLRELEPRLAEAERGAGTPQNPAPTTSPASSNPTENVGELVRKAIGAERERSAAILAAVRTARLGDEFAEKLINDGVSVDKAREAIIEAWAKNEPVQPKGGNVSVSKDETDKRRGVMIDALVLRSGQIPEKDIKAEVISAAREFRSMSLLDMAKESLERSGVNTRGMDKMDMARAAISSSTSDFPVLLAGTNRRILLAAYATIPDTWRQFCAVGSVGDFREYSRLRMQSSFNKLDKVDENAEYKNKKINDAQGEKVSVDTFGNTINITRKMIVNDDLNAFARLSAMLGRAAARSIEIDVYALLGLNSGLGPVMSDNKTLFHADHGNLITTGAGAPSVEQFEKIRLAMAKQKDLGVDDYLDLRPSIWLGPIELGGEARVVNDAQYDVNVTSKFQVPNRVRGLFGNIIDTPRLSGTGYYAFANPADEPVIEVNFLDGIQTPMMEQEQTFDVDGLRWKVRMDYGVDAIGWRGAVRNAGA